jgi:uncharacterized protein (DUF39 family)
MNSVLSTNANTSINISTKSNIIGREQAYIEGVGTRSTRQKMTLMKFGPMGE